MHWLLDPQTRKKEQCHGGFCFELIRFGLACVLSTTRWFVGTVGMGIGHIVSLKLCYMVRFRLCMGFAALNYTNPIELNPIHSPIVFSLREPIGLKGFSTLWFLQTPKIYQYGFSNSHSSVFPLIFFHASIHSLSSTGLDPFLNLRLYGALKGPSRG